MEQNDVYNLQIRSNKGNIINIKINIFLNKLEIKASFVKNYFTNSYIGNFSLEELKRKSNYYNQFNNINMLMREIKRINNKKAIENENNDKIILIFVVDSANYPSIFFILRLKPKSDREKLEECERVIKLLNDKLINKENELNFLKNKHYIQNFNSRIVQDINKIEVIKFWISPFENLRSNLIYSYYDRNYRFLNGAYNYEKFQDVRTFHQNCDNKPNLLIICKSNNEIFGGFTPLSFSEGNIRGNDNNSFIFSINRLEKYPKIEQNNTTSIWKYRNYGPCFSYDLCFEENGMNIITKKKNRYTIYENYINKHYSYFNESNEKYLIDSLEIFQINYI